MENTTTQEPVEEIEQVRALAKPKNSAPEDAVWLDLSFQSLSAVPACVTLFVNLETLLLNNNDLVDELPASLGCLKKLKTLNLCDNKFDSLPEWIAELENLTSLFLERDGKSSVVYAPRGIILLPCWKNDEKLVWMKYSVRETLSKLVLYSHAPFYVEQGIEDMNVVMDDITGSKVVDVSLNKISVIPETIEKHTQLQILVASKNQISLIPKSVTVLTNLVVLDLSNNLVSAVPSEIQFLRLLRELHLQKNKIFELPKEMESLSSLQVLNISGNLFVTFPNVVATMVWITSLNISNNKIPALPEAMSKMKDLAILDASNNRIDTIPAFIGGLEKLVSGLEVKGNPAKNIPRNVLKRGSEAIIDFLSASSKGGSQKWRQGRLLLLGESQSGKTTLARTLARNATVFSSLRQEKTEQTDGIDYTDIQIQNEATGAVPEPISIRMWDFAGSAEFGPSHPLFVTAGALVLVLYRLDQGKDANKLSRWVPMLNDCAPGSKVILLGTHKDRQNQKACEEMKKEIKSLRLSCPDVSFMSLKTRVNIHNARDVDELKQLIYQGMIQLDCINKYVPKAFLELQKFLQEKAKTSKFLKIEQIYEHAAKSLQLNERRCEIALKFLHDIGSILWYSSSESIKGFVFPDPDFIVRIFRCVFSFKGVGKKAQGTGMVMISQLKQKLNQVFNIKMDEQVFAVIVGIMDHFALGTQFNKECLIFPSLMDELQSIKSIWNEKRESNCIAEISADLATTHAAQPNDKSGIIMQMLRLSKVNTPSNVTNENSFYSNASVIHVTSQQAGSASSSKRDSDDIKLVPGDDLRVLVHILPSKVSIVVRKYEVRGERKESIDIFKVLNHLKQQIVTIRPNVFKHCEMDCAETGKDGSKQTVKTSVAQYHELEVVRSTSGQAVDFEAAKQGRVFLGSDEHPRYLTEAKRKHKPAPPKGTKTLELASIDSELKSLWTTEQIELGEFIANGTYGRVFKARLKSMDKDVAVKIQTVQAVGKYTLQEVIESAILESKLLFECRECENIARLLKVYRRESNFYMVMEYAGTSLKKLIETGKETRPTLAQMMQYSKQICQALLFMQSKNIYHEDLKADNVVVEKGVAKLVDFGFVSKREAEKIGSQLPTRLGEWKQNGSKNWQAPEIFQVVSKPHFSDERKYGEDGINVGHRGEASSVYAFGLLVWYMFSGVEPFLYEPQPQSNAMQGLRPEIGDKTPNEMVRLIKTCWKQNYKHRPALKNILQYFTEIVANNIRIAPERAQQLLPVKYARLDDMYRGEFIEFLDDFQLTEVKEQAAKEDWTTVSGKYGPSASSKLASLYPKLASQITSAVQAMQGSAVLPPAYASKFTFQDYQAYELSLQPPKALSVVRPSSSFILGGLSHQFHSSPFGQFVQSFPAPPQFFQMPQAPQFQSMISNIQHTLQEKLPASFQNVLPTSLQDILPTSLQDILPTSLQDILPAVLQDILPASLQSHNEQRPPKKQETLAIAPPPSQDGVPANEALAAVTQATTDQVVEWLEYLGLPNAAKLAQQYSLSGKDIIGASEEEIIKFFGAEDAAKILPVLARIQESCITGEYVPMPPTKAAGHAGASSSAGASATNHPAQTAHQTTANSAALDQDAAHDDEHENTTGKPNKRKKHRCLIL